MQFGSNLNDQKMVKEPNANIVPGKKAAVVKRMKGDFEKSHKAEEAEKPTTSRQTKMENFVVKTSGTDIKKFDISIARFFYSSNIPFHAADSSEFKKMVDILHPGYKPPNSKSIGCHCLTKSIII